MADTSNVNTNTALGNVGRQMESILNNLGLGVLSERFARERMEPETVLSASDADLERLGVDTIGQRIRIRELCSKEMEQQQSGTLAALVQQERSLLFTPVDLCIWWPWAFTQCQKWEGNWYCKTKGTTMDATVRLPGESVLHQGTLKH